MDKTGNDNRTSGGALDIGEDDVYRNETDREIRSPDDPEALDPDDLPNADAVRAAVKYGRDAFIVKSDIDPAEDNYAPGIREQD